VAGVSSSQKEDLQEEFGKFAGKPLDLQRLETELTRATGSGRFDLLGYETFPASEGTGLRIDAHEKPMARPSSIWPSTFRVRAQGL